MVSGWSMYIYLYFGRLGTLPGPGQMDGYLIVTGASILLAFLFRVANQKLDEWLPWKEHFALRFLSAVLIGLLLITICAILGITLASAMHSGLMQAAMNNTEEWIKLWILSAFLLLIFQAAYFSVYSYQQFAIVQLNKYANQREQLRLQFEALKSQLSPHFLFNSLNTISSLVHKNAEDAEEFIRRLAVTYKYVISKKQEKLVSVNEEVEFIKSYYHLLKVRFEDALKLDINLPKSVLKTQIPPMTLQILIENAVKHNRVDPDHPLGIYINAIDNTRLCVTNNKLLSNGEVKSFKVGLDNIKNRYAYYSGEKIRIVDGEKFSVELPVISKNHPN